MYKPSDRICSWDGKSSKNNPQTIASTSTPQRTVRLQGVVEQHLEESMRLGYIVAQLCS